MAGISGAGISLEPENTLCVVGNGEEGQTGTGQESRWHPGVAASCGKEGTGLSGDGRQREQSVARTEFCVLWSDPWKLESRDVLGAEQRVSRDRW